MYYGGAQKRPDAPYARAVTSASGHVIGHVGEANRKDVRNAVEAAHIAAPGYEDFVGAGKCFWDVFRLGPWIAQDIVARV